MSGVGIDDDFNNSVDGSDDAGPDQQREETTKTTTAARGGMVEVIDVDVATDGDDVDGDGVPVDGGEDHGGVNHSGGGGGASGAGPGREDTTTGGGEVIMIDVDLPVDGDGGAQVEDVEMGNDETDGGGAGATAGSNDDDEGRKVTGDRGDGSAEEDEEVVSSSLAGDDDGGGDLGGSEHGNDDSSDPNRREEETTTKTTTPREVIMIDVDVEGSDGDGPHNAEDMEMGDEGADDRQVTLDRGDGTRADGEAMVLSLSGGEHVGGGGEKHESDDRSPGDGDSETGAGVDDEAREGGGGEGVVAMMETGGDHDDDDDRPPPDRPEPNPVSTTAPVPSSSSSSSSGGLATPAPQAESASASSVPSPTGEETGTPTVASVAMTPDDPAGDEEVSTTKLHEDGGKTVDGKRRRDDAEDDNDNDDSSAKSSPPTKRHVVIVDVPHEHDVLLLRRGGTVRLIPSVDDSKGQNIYPHGNERFHSIVGGICATSRRDRIPGVDYLDTSPPDEAAAVRRVLAAVRGLDPPGRFVERRLLRPGEGARWIELVGDDDVEKTLRDVVTRALSRVWGDDDGDDDGGHSRAPPQDLDRGGPRSGGGDEMGMRPEAKKKSSSSPDNDADPLTPRKHDVLLRRDPAGILRVHDYPEHSRDGGRSNPHPGNRVHRSLVDVRVMQAQSAAAGGGDEEGRRSHRFAVARLAGEVVSAVHDLDPPGRFLEWKVPRDDARSVGKGVWSEVCDEEAEGVTRRALLLASPPSSAPSPKPCPADDGEAPPKAAAPAETPRDKEAKSSSPAPPTLVADVVPRRNDVLLRRDDMAGGGMLRVIHDEPDVDGGFGAPHPGNEMHKSLVDARVGRLEGDGGDGAPDRHVVAELADEVLSYVRGMDPPGRFLQRRGLSSGPDGKAEAMWFEVSDEEAHGVTRRALLLAVSSSSSSSSTTPKAPAPAPAEAPTPAGPLEAPAVRNISDPAQCRQGGGRIGQSGQHVPGMQRHPAPPYAGWDQRLGANYSPSSHVEVPGEHDVILRRGDGGVLTLLRELLFWQRGNETFSFVVESMRARYRDVRDRGDRYRHPPAAADGVAGEVVAAMKNLDPPGRFLERIRPDWGKDSVSWWIEVTQSEARDVASRELLAEPSHSKHVRATAANAAAASAVISTPHLAATAAAMATMGTVNGRPWPHAPPQLPPPQPPQPPQRVDYSSVVPGAPFFPPPPPPPPHLPPPPGGFHPQTLTMVGGGGIGFAPHHGHGRGHPTVGQWGWGHHRMWGAGAPLPPAAQPAGGAPHGVAMGGMAAQSQLSSTPAPAAAPPAPPPTRYYNVTFATKEPLGLWLDEKGDDPSDATNARSRLLGCRVSGLRRDTQAWTRHRDKINVGDRIVAVDGMNVQGSTVDGVVAALKSGGMGGKGGVVVTFVRRNRVVGASGASLPPPRKKRRYAVVVAVPHGAWNGGREFVPGERVTVPTRTGGTGVGGGDLLGVTVPHGALPRTASTASTAWGMRNGMRYSHILVVLPEDYAVPDTRTRPPPPIPAPTPALTSAPALAPDVVTSLPRTVAGGDEEKKSEDDTPPTSGPPPLSVMRFYRKDLFDKDDRPLSLGIQLGQASASSSPGVRRKKKRRIGDGGDAGDGAGDSSSSSSSNPAVDVVVVVKSVNRKSPAERLGIAVGKIVVSVNGLLVGHDASSVGSVVRSVMEDAAAGRGHGGEAAPLLEFELCDPEHVVAAGGAPSFPPPAVGSDRGSGSAWMRSSHPRKRPCGDAEVARGGVTTPGDVSAGGETDRGGYYDGSGNGGDRREEKLVVVRFNESELFEDIDAGKKRPRSLGMGLGQVSFHNGTHTVIKSISPNSPADGRGDLLKVGLVVTSVNGRNVEGAIADGGASGVASVVREALCGLMATGNSAGGEGERTPVLEMLFRDLGPSFRSKVSALYSAKKTPGTDTSAEPSNDVGATSRNEEGKIDEAGPTHRPDIGREYDGDAAKSSAGNLTEAAPGEEGVIDAREKTDDDGAATFVVRFGRSELFEDDVESGGKKRRPLGILLGQALINNKMRVVVCDVASDSPAGERKDIVKCLIVIAVNGRPTEGEDASDVSTMVGSVLSDLSTAGGGEHDALEMTFLDPGEVVRSKLEKEYAGRRKNATSGKVEPGESCHVDQHEEDDHSSQSKTDYGATSDVASHHHPPRTGECPPNSSSQGPPQSSAMLVQQQKEQQEVQGMPHRQPEQAQSGRPPCNPPMPLYLQQENGRHIRCPAPPGEPAPVSVPSPPSPPSRGPPSHNNLHHPSSISVENPNKPAQAPLGRKTTPPKNKDPRVVEFCTDRSLGMLLEPLVSTTKGLGESDSNDVGCRVEGFDTSCEGGSQAWESGKVHRGDVIAKIGTRNVLTSRYDDILAMLRPSLAESRFDDENGGGMDCGHGPKPNTLVVTFVQNNENKDKRRDVV